MLFGNVELCPAMWYPQPEIIRTININAQRSRIPLMATSPPALSRSPPAAECCPLLPKTTTPPASPHPPPAFPAAPLFLRPPLRCSFPVLHPTESKSLRPRTPRRSAQTSFQAEAPRTPKTPCHRIRVHGSIAAPA